MKINQPMSSGQEQRSRWNWRNISRPGIVQLAVRAPFGFLTMPRPKLKTHLPQIC